MALRLARPERDNWHAPLSLAVILGVLMSVGGAACSSDAPPPDATLAPPGPGVPSPEGDGGAPSGPKADGEACGVDDECASQTCIEGVCRAPSPTDGRKNGDETDVDCGGAVAPKCAVGKACRTHDDCESGACPTSVCRASRSCKRHFGGETCGAGEVGQPNAQHEDCCLSIQPGDHPFRVDKYLITAGRMRAFIEDVRAEHEGVPNVRAWVAAHVPEWPEAWNTSLPSNEAELVRLIGTGQDPGAGWSSQGQANGCYVGTLGGPTYWHPAEELANHAGDVARAFTRDELDVKVLNCTPAALFAAFCAYDGGRLPTPEEWTLAVRGDKPAGEWLFPWGNPVGSTKAAVDAEINERASYNKNYQFPPAPPGAELANDGLPVDRAFEVPAPGRFPLGAGPFGHADMLGVAETMVFDTRFRMVRQYAFQEAYYGVAPYGNLHNMNPYTSHYAVAARCARPL